MTQLIRTTSHAKINGVLCDSVTTSTSSSKEV